MSTDTLQSAQTRECVVDGAAAGNTAAASARPGVPAHPWRGLPTWRRACLHAVALLLLASGCSTSEEPPAPEASPISTPEPPGGPGIASLSQLSVAALRERGYGSTIAIEKRVDTTPWPSYLASYDSDGLHVYTRIDVPATPPPADGYPVVVFIHGWRGIEAAPSLDFYYAEDSYYHDMIVAYVEAGFVVFAPGWRGHGTVNGAPAEGIDYLAAWDNGSYLSPVFYAIDVLNLLDSLGSFAEAPLAADGVNLVGHSQGGDVALIALAVAGEGSGLRGEINAASIWSGTFASRFAQLVTYEPMQKSRQAFLAGDGSWNGTAVGADGSVNPHFVFGYPADWIETVDVAEWTWQHDTWSLPTVAEALTIKLDQMYRAINEHVADIDDASYRIDVQPGAAAVIAHDARVAEAMARIGGFDQVRFLTEPLALQHSDRDFHSPPEWNADLCRRINAAGGACRAYEYEGNTHSLGVSEHRWFSSEQAEPGFATAVRRDVALFRGGHSPE